MAECTTVEAFLSRLAILYATSPDMLRTTYINWPICDSSKPGQMKSAEMQDLMNHPDSMCVFVIVPFASLCVFLVFIIFV
jgi:hypothetical protein